MRATADQDTKLFMAISMVAIFSLFLRMKDFNYIAESLWCEDGSLLLTDAYHFGVRSLVIPATGYLHLYHRLVALIATYLPLQIAPDVCMIGWFAAFLIVVAAVVERGRSLGLDNMSLALVVLAISLQPNDGESLLTLGQSYFFLNVAFSLYICVPSSRPVKVGYTLLLVLLSLTGPACEILSLILLVRLVVLKDFLSRTREYLVVWLCAIIQGFLTTLDFGGSTRELNENPADWAQAIFTFLCFGSHSNLVRSAAAAFWAITFICGVGEIKGSIGKSCAPSWLPSVLLSITVGGSLVAGMLREGADIARMSPVDHAARYFVLPYSLSFFVAFLATKNKYAPRLVVLFSIALICGASFLTVDRPDRMGTTGLYGHENLQWAAFTKFQRLKPDLEIPTNPPWAIWPPVWFVKASHEHSVPKEEHSARPITLDIFSLKGRSSTLERRDHYVLASLPESDPVISFSLGGNCVGKRFLAIEVDVWRSKPGWAVLYWGGAKGFSKANSLRRFYPSGDVTMQFAFRREVSEADMGLQLMGGVEKWFMQELVKKDRDSVPDIENAVPQPTAAGGLAAIKAIRLFCLEP